MNGPKDSRSWPVLGQVGLATLVSFLLRIWPVGHLGLDQFDEGIYVLAAAWVNSPQGWLILDPTLIPYAPPGYPILVGLFSFLVGLSDQTGLMVSALSGTLTVPIVARISQKLFDSRAAVVAAWCVCCAGPHIALSRMGLTDATFLLIWSVGYLISLRFFENPTLWSGSLMGLIVGFTQQVKYNGWLLGGLVIATVGLSLALCGKDRPLRAWLRYGIWGGWAAILAWLVVFPWFRFVEDHGGYAGLLRHQRSYLGGAANWWPFLQAQVNQALLLAGPLTLSLMACVFIAWSAWFVRLRPAQTTRSRGWLDCGMACLILPLLSLPVLSGCLVVPTLELRRRIEHRFAVISWGILFVLSPCYHPYARLWLPFEMVHWVLLGGLASSFVNLLETKLEFRSWSQRLGWLQLGCAGVLLISFVFSGPGFPFAHVSAYGHEGLFGPSDSLRITADQVNEQIPSSVPVLRTFVRPTMFYYLSGQHRIQPQTDLGQLLKAGPPGAWALVDSTLLTSQLVGSDRTGLDHFIEPLKSRWEVVQVFAAPTSLPTALDLDPFRRDYHRDQALAIFWLFRPQARTGPS